MFSFICYPSSTICQTIPQTNEGSSRYVDMVTFSVSHLFYVEFLPYKVLAKDYLVDQRKLSTEETEHTPSHF